MLPKVEVFGYVLNISSPAAVKTGTTENYKDSLAIGVWVGNNAFTGLGDVQLKDQGNTHEILVQFCKVEVDTTQRVPRHKELEEDFDTLMWVATQR